MSLEYREEQDKLKELKIMEIQQNMPPFFTQFMMAIGHSKSLNTQLSYAKEIRFFLEWLVTEHPYSKGKDIMSLTGDDLNSVTFHDADVFSYHVQSYKKKDKNGNIKLVKNKPATINAYISAVSSMYKCLYRRGIVKSNPFDGMERAKIIDEPKIRLDEIDSERFFSAITDGEGITEHMSLYRKNDHTVLRDLCICSILETTGIRVSELVGLDVDDIDIQRCRFPVVRKGGKIEYVYFSDYIRELLMEYLEIRPLFHPDENDKALFLRTQGRKCKRDGEGNIIKDEESSDKRLSVTGMERIVKKYAKAAAVVNASRFTPHKLRHTYATNTIKKTGNLVLLQKQMGHASIQSTTIYAQADDTDLKNARNISMEE